MSELFYIAKSVYSKGIYSNCESSMLENDLVIIALNYIRHIVRKGLPLIGSVLFTFGCSILHI